MLLFLFENLFSSFSRVFGEIYLLFFFKVFNLQENLFRFLGDFPPCFLGNLFSCFFGNILFSCFFLLRNTWLFGQNVLCICTYSITVGVPQYKIYDLVISIDLSIPLFRLVERSLKASDQWFGSTRTSKETGFIKVFP